jgi:hypothetical protein
MNRLKVMSLWPYLIVGAGLWFFFLKSGVHATLAGVILAMTIPITKSPSRPDDEHSPLHRLEHGLAPWVAYLVVPVFGFANAGVALGQVGLAELTAPATLGAALGLFLGKPIGVGLFCLAVIKLGWAQRPSGAPGAHVFGVSALCGIGFTMSLFINNLAFDADPAGRDQDRRAGRFAAVGPAGLVGVQPGVAAGAPHISGQSLIRELAMRVALVSAALLLGAAQPALAAPAVSRSRSRSARSWPRRSMTWAPRVRHPDRRTAARGRAPPAAAAGRRDPVPGDRGRQAQPPHGRSSWATPRACRWRASASAGPRSAALCRRGRTAHADRLQLVGKRHPLGPVRLDLARRRRRLRPPRRSSGQGPVRRRR